MIPERWKRDPLSAFLTFAALLLLVFYGLEEWRRGTVEDAQFTASQLKAPAECRLTTSGLRGEVLVLHCPKKSVSEISGGIDGDDVFETVYVVGRDGRKRLR